MKPSLPQGTRDFGPETVRKRSFIFNTIRNVFELYGFQPLETPAMENIETLMGKYGDEGDKLIFRILNNGLDNPDKERQARDDFEKVLKGKNVKGITERALKYDLTIPFARYVAMNHGRLSFPFKRYQLQPVWRAERPQQSRYREFYQCDADIIGSRSLMNEVELANIYHEALTGLGIRNYELKINHRNVLAALAEIAGAPGRLTDITIAIDKLDKIGLEKVKEELAGKGISKDKLVLIENYLAITGSNDEKLSRLKTLLGNNEKGLKGIKELEYLVHFSSRNKTVSSEESTPKLIIDFTLARGLNYYTGIIFEVKATDVSIGSIGGGGRYDDLTGLFGLPNIPGVGISFGVDRIYDVMEKLDLFPEGIETGTKILFLNLGETESEKTFGVMQQLRQKGLPCEIYPDTTKVDKQFKYAENKNIPYVITIGEIELKDGVCKIKNIRTGDMQTIPVQDLVNYPFSF